MPLATTRLIALKKSVVCMGVLGWGGDGLTEVELAVGLLEVDDVESVLEVGAHVGHLEVEPLRVGPRVGVCVQNQVVLPLPHLGRKMKTLER